MKEQFEMEQTVESGEVLIGEVQIPSEEDAPLNEEDERRKKEEEERRIREDEAHRQEKERQRRELAAGKLRFAANRIGWTTAVLVAVWLGMSFLVSDFCWVLEGFGSLDFNFSSEAFYNKYALIINELTLAVGIAVAAAILASVQKVNLNKEKLGAGYFLKVLVMCFGAGYIGNMIGTRMLSFWNLFTGNSAGDELVTLLSGIDPLMMLISVGILAPILEELFFRKLLTDRLRVFGETTSILFTAFLFALFHMSAEQFIYAFTVGILLGYFYCRSGNYWLTVLLHAIFNTVSGVIPMLFMPKLNELIIEVNSAFGVDFEYLETMDADMIWELTEPLLKEFGSVIALYGLYALIVFALNVTGVILLVVSIKKFKARGGEYTLSFKESARIVFKTPGVIVCTALLGVMTVLSLFS